MQVELRTRIGEETWKFRLEMKRPRPRRRDITQNHWLDTSGGSSGHSVPEIGRPGRQAAFPAPAGLVLELHTA